MLNANGLSASITSPQMRLPARPRLPETLINIWHNQQTLVILGSMSDVVLRGKSVSALMPRLLPLLNGTLTPEQVAERLPDIAPKIVRDALLLLQMQGVLEDGAPASSDLPAATRRAFADQLRFYSRYVDYTRAQRNRADVLARLQASAVLLVARGAGAAQTARELASLGVGRIDVLPLAGDATAWAELSTSHTAVALADRDLDALEGAGLDGQRLLLLVSDRPETALTRRLNRLALRTRVPFMRAYLDPAGPIEIGPTVYAGETACYECALTSGALSLEEGAPTSAAAGAEVVLGASQTALFSLAILTTLLPVATGHALHRLDPASLHFAPQSIYRLPGCPACSAYAGYAAERELAIGPAHSESFAAFYHANSLDRHYAQFPKSYQDHYSSQNAQSVLAGFKSYTNAPAVDVRPWLDAAPAAFDAAYPGPDAPAQPVTPPGLGAIATLLASAASRRNPQGDFDPAGPLRLTPSGGNFASQTLYLLNLGLPELERGLYHFNPHGLRLERLERGAGIAGLRPSLPAEIDLSKVAAVIIQTAAFGRLDAKYPLKGYQIALYDSGAMLTSLEVAGGALGLDLRTSLDFYDDELRGLLGLSDPFELPLTVTLVAGAQPGRSDGENADDNA
jgi:SagB-type dehydrogenase family enzyme